jgi:hypothetical protein
MRIALTAAFLLLAALINGCGPIYGTEYRYSPPPEPEARSCVALCRNTQQLCRSTAENRAERETMRCEVEANRDYERCLRAGRRDREALSRCHLRTCPTHLPHDGHCTEEFNLCYTECGGEVEVERVCQFNCP